MKTVAVKENKSFFNKLIDKLKNSALFSMAFDENYGTVLDSEEENKEALLKKLSINSNTSESELEEIDKSFEVAENNTKKLEEKISKIPELKKDSSNPFRVDESELIHDEEQIIDTKTQKENYKQNQDREISD